MNADEFRRLGHQLIDWVAEYRERIEDRPVMSPARPGEIRSRFPVSPPADGGHLPKALASLESDVLRGITHWNHPAFFAYFPSNTAYASVLADILASGLGVQGMSWQTSPAATEIEEVVMDWLRQMVGLSPAWSGVIHDTASTATLCALLCAREKASGFSQQDAGLILKSNRRIGLILRARRSQGCDVGSKWRKASVKRVFIRLSSAFVFHRYPQVHCERFRCKGANLCDCLFDRFRRQAVCTERSESAEVRDRCRQFL